LSVCETDSTEFYNKLKINGIRGSAIIPTRKPKKQEDEKE